MTDLLLIESYYNNNITEELINQYKDKILFCYIDQKNLKLFVDKFSITKYYSFYEIIEDYKNYNIINYYYLRESIDKMMISENKGIIKTISESNKLLWADVYNGINYKYIIKEDCYKWNILSNNIIYKYI